MTETEIYAVAVVLSKIEECSIEEAIKIVRDRLARGEKAIEL